MNNGYGHNITVEGKKLFRSFVTVDWGGTNRESDWTIAANAIEGGILQLSGGGVLNITIDKRPAQALMSFAGDMIALEGTGPFPFTRSEWEAMIPPGEDAGDVDEQ